MKKVFAIISAISLFLCGCADVKIPIENNKTKQSDQINWTISDSDISLENDFLLFDFIKDTGELRLTDKVSEKVYSSRHGLSADENSALAEISIDYYDDQSAIHTMDCYNNCLKLNSLTAYKSEEGIKIQYEFNEESADILVPAVLSVEKYDSLKKNITSSDFQKLSMYYELVYSSDDTSRVQALKEKYPYLNKNDLYVVFDSLMTSEKKKISAIFKSAGYSTDEYLKDIEAMGISQSNINIPISFIIPVEYKLLEDGISAEVLCDQIDYPKSLATLQKIRVLPGFGLCGERAEKYYLVDGCGSVVTLSEKSDQFITIPIYGGDLTVDSAKTTDLSQSYRLPLCACSSSGGSWVAVVESAAEAGYINAEVKGVSNKSDSLYYSFDFEAMDKLSIRPGSNISDMNYYSGRTLSVNPRISYHIKKGGVKFETVSKIYRSLLNEQYGIKDRKSNGGLIWLEFTGYEMVDTTVMGIPKQKKVILSKLSEIIKEVNLLHKNGVRNISIRLKGIGNYGLNHAAANTFELDSSVGTIDELIKLSRILNKNGGKLYIENDVSFSYKDYSFDGFTPKKDACYALGGKIAYKSDFDLVEISYKNNVDVKYIVSPDNYLPYMTEFADKLSSVIKNNEIGVSWAAGGMWLFSNFNEKKVLDRSDALKHSISTFNYMKKNFKSVMTDGGNLYAIENSDCIVNAPLYSSSHLIESQQIPLYNTIIHGIVDYAGESISTSLHSDVVKLRCVELGAGLFYSCVTEEDAYRELKAYRRSGIFAPDVDMFTDEIINDYKTYGSFYKNKAGCYITGVSTISNGVVKTEYSNGSFSLVNKSNTAISIDGHKIAAKSSYLSEVS